MFRLSYSYLVLVLGKGSDDDHFNLGFTTVNLLKHKYFYLPDIFMADYIIKYAILVIKVKLIILETVFQISHQQ